MTSIVYKTDTEDIAEVLDVYKRGGKVLCPVCNIELLIVDTWESASIYKKPPGIYCLTDEKHVCGKFLLADKHDEIWQRFEQRKSRPC